MEVKLPRAHLERAEFLFRCTFAQHGTEDRLLIYRDAQGNLRGHHPQADRRRGSVTNDLPLTIEREGRLWDLVADLHSHHVMGAFWSGTDNANERIRGPIFGVVSWKGGPARWLFRRWTPGGFVDLPWEEVVADV